MQKMAVNQYWQSVDTSTLACLTWSIYSLKISLINRQFIKKLKAATEIR
jgi:hypothetical protein